MENNELEYQFLQNLIKKDIDYINHSRFDVKTIINNISVCDPPDFIYDNHYIEKFEVDDYRRTPNPKGKLESSHLRDENKLNLRVKTPQSIFNTVHFYSPDERSNIQFLKDNIVALIDNKTAKQINYDAAYPQAEFRHLLIYLKCLPEVIKDDSGNFIIGMDDITQSISEKNRIP